MRYFKVFKRRRNRVAAVSLATAILIIIGLNASFLAPSPKGRPLLIAQRGVHQIFDDTNVDANTCTARRIQRIEHPLIENTLPSIAAAFRSGADVVEVDVRQARDGAFVLFHDDRLECRTQGHGRVFDTGLATLRTLDVGYGYTADGGRTFPLRGRGVGLMPTLAEALRAFPGRSFMIQIKSGYVSEGDALVRYLERHRIDDWSRLIFFGAPIAVERLERLRPQARVWTDKGLISCTTRYLAIGWTGYVPQACRGGMIAVPVNLRFAVWGWPNRFIARMGDADTRMLALRATGGGGFARIDTPEDLDSLPVDYNGYIWTDRVETIGPAARRRFHRQTGGVPPGLER